MVGVFHKHSFPPLPRAKFQVLTASLINLLSGMQESLLLYSYKY